MLTVICYHTDDNLYRKHAKILECSAKKWGLNFKAYQYAKDDWLTITALKSTMVQQAREEFKGGLLYIDADAIILKDISHYFNSVSEDVGVHYFKDEELLSSTVFFNDTDGARKIIDEWVNEQKKTDEWDQKVLQKVIAKLAQDNTVSEKRIPEEFAFIYDLSKAFYGDSVVPSIEQFQASRANHWKKKYQKKNFIMKKILLTNLKKITRNLKTNLSHINHRCEELGIDIRFSIDDLIDH